MGHSQSYKLLHSRKEERDELADKIKLNMSFNRILNEIRKKGETIGRLHILDKRDLYNIVRDYDLDRDIAHKNDD